MLYAMDATVNTCCLLLTFSYYKSYYNKSCFLCRKCCEEPFIHCLDKEFKTAKFIIIKGIKDL